MSVLFQKGRLAAKATYKHFLSYLRYRREHFNSLFKPPILDHNSSESLVHISGEEDLLAWNLDTDYRKGGNSTCRAKVEDNTCKKIFSGF
jgi:hypothetical protein